MPLELPFSSVIASDKSIIVQQVDLDHASTVHLLSCQMNREST
mgnify:FL=1